MMAMISRRLFCVSTAALAGCDSFADPQQIRVLPNLYNGEGADELAAMVPKTLGWDTQIAPLTEPGERMLLQGTVFSWQTGEPVSNVVVYAYHTDTKGVYQLDASRKAALRGWTRTSADGRYAFDTIKPGIYPSRTDAAHVHMWVIEPGRLPYWIDNVVFEGEFGVDVKKLARGDNRGGSGVTRLTRDASGAWLGARDIQLERHPA
jgi:protocatechuate 3,4-dioxygenase, beta subunit